MRLAGLFFIIMCVMGGVGYWYYTDTQERLQILQENNAKLEVAVITNEQALSSLQADYANAQKELSEINIAYQNIRRQNQQLAEKLRDVDLQSAALSNSRAAERIVNRGTVNANRCFELLSGAELNEKERKAKNDIAFNKECPWLYDTYKSRGLLNQTTNN